MRNAKLRNHLKAVFYMFFNYVLCPTLCSFFNFLLFSVQTEVDSSHKSDEVRNSFATCLQSQLFSLNTMGILFFIRVLLSSR